MNFITLHTATEDQPVVINTQIIAFISYNDGGNTAVSLVSGMTFLVSETPPQIQQMLTA